MTVFVHHLSNETYRGCLTLGGLRPGSDGCTRTRNGSRPYVIHFRHGGQPRSQDHLRDGGPSPRPCDYESGTSDTEGSRTRAPECL